MMKIMWMATLVVFAAGCSGAEAGAGDVQQGSSKGKVAAGVCDPLDPNGPTPTCHAIPDDGAAGAPVGVNDPCAAVDVAPDGVCTKELCDPDCTSVTTVGPDGNPIVDPVVGPDGNPIVTDPCAAVDVIPDGVCTKELCDPDCVSK